MSTPKAPDLETLFNVEGEIDPMIIDALNDAGIGKAETERGTTNTGTPRVSAQFHLGEAVSMRKIPVGAQDRRDALTDTWKCTWLFHVVTDRNKDTGEHGKYRAKVRLLMAGFFRNLNSRLPYHFFQEMKEMGTTPSMYNEHAKDEDISRIQFQGVITIRAAAWPDGV